MRFLTKEQMFPQQENWILESFSEDLYKMDENGDLLDYEWVDVTFQWYERPNEDNLLNTLTEALEGAYEYD